MGAHVRDLVVTTPNVLSAVRYAKLSKGHRAKPIAVSPPDDTKERNFHHEPSHFEAIVAIMEASKETDSGLNQVGT